MTQPDPGPPAQPVQPPPPKVGEAAAARQLGRLMMAQKGSNPFGNLAFGIGIAVVLVLVALGLGWAASATGIRVLGWLTCLLIVGAIIVLVYSVMALLAGFTATYLFQNGLAHTKNGKVEVVTWPEIDELWLWKAGGKTAVAGTLLCYYIVTFDGRKIPVEPASDKGDKGVGQQLEHIVRSLGRKITDSGPYVGKLRP